MIKNLYIVILLLAAFFTAAAQEPDTITTDITTSDEAPASSGDTSPDVTVIDEAVADGKVVVELITFKELKYTQEKYLLSRIGVKTGDEWNDAARARIKTDLAARGKIIEEVLSIDEVIDGGKATITIDVVEKLPLLILPFFTYKNSSGIVPKVLFRYYNLGGYEKYLNFKMQYEPRKNIFFTGRFKDESFFNNDNLTFQITVDLSTSAPNYYTVAPPQNIGVLGQPDSGESVPWKDELNFETVLDTYVQYIVPGIGTKLKPYIYFKYKKIWYSFDSDVLAPKDEIDTKAGMEISYPVNSIFKIQPHFEGQYKLLFNSDTIGFSGDATQDESDIKGKIEQTFTGFAQVKFPIVVKAIDSTITPGVKITSENIVSQFLVAGYNFYPNYGDAGYFNNKLLLDLSLAFYKKINFKKTEHEIDLKSRFQISMLDYKIYPESESTNIKNSFNPDAFKAYNDFKYKFKLTFFKGHIFTMKYYLFYYHNAVLDHTGGYKMNEYPGSIKGWAGLIANFAYIIPVLEFTTPRWFGKSIDRPLRWKMLWEIYVDAGLSQGYEGNGNLSLNRWGLHLNPAAGIGTAIKFDPVFIPAYIKIDFGIDLWRIAKTKAFSGSIIFSFTIEDN